MWREHNSVICLIVELHFYRKITPQLDNISVSKKWLAKLEYKHEEDISNFEFKTEKKSMHRNVAVV